jgi:hypothetical protein
VARAGSARFIAELAAMLPRIATISIPPVTEALSSSRRIERVVTFGTTCKRAAASESR